MHYQAIESLREYVIVSHREVRVDHQRRLDSGQWLLTTHVGGEERLMLQALDDAIELSALGLTSRGVRESPHE